jgi:hypothetical protein
MHMSDGTIPIENTSTAAVSKDSHQKRTVMYRTVLPISKPYNSESESSSDLRMGKPYTSKSHVCNKAPLSSCSLNQ